jgi:hypothetical protein
MQKELGLNPETLQVILNEKPMLRMLTIVVESGSKGIATRRLLEKLGANGLHRLLPAAQKRGYIKRVKVKKPKGQKGNYLMVNLLTPEGKRIVKTAKGLGLV